MNGNSSLRLPTKLTEPVGLTHLSQPFLEVGVQNAPSAINLLSALIGCHMERNEIQNKLTFLLAVALRSGTPLFLVAPMQQDLD